MNCFDSVDPVSVHGKFLKNFFESAKERQRHGHVCAAQKGADAKDVYRDEVHCFSSDFFTLIWNGSLFTIPTTSAENL